MKSLRSLIKVLPSLSPSQKIQASKIKKVIANTFLPPDDFKELLGGVPPSHVEKVYEVFSKLSFKAFEMGFSCKFESLPLEARTELTQDFFDAVGSVLGIENKDHFIPSLQRSLEMAFNEGREQCLQSPKEEKAVPELVAKDLGIHEVSASNHVMQKNSMSKEQIMEQIRAYSRMLPEEEQQRVLRYYLGLGDEAPAVSVAEAEKQEPKADEEKPKADEAPEEIDEVEIIEEPIEPSLPYDPIELRESILKLLPNLDLDNEDIQMIFVDCPLLDIAHQSDDEKCLAISEFLDIECADLESCMHELDAVAEFLSAELALPGEVCFVEQGDDICLVYAFETDKYAKHMDLIKAGLSGKSEAKVTESWRVKFPAKQTEAAAKKAKKAKSEKSKEAYPKSGISVAEKKELAWLAKQSKLDNMKELKKNAPTVATHFGNLLRKVRASQLSISEGGKELRKPMAEVIKEVYGEDGLACWQGMK